MLSVIEPGMERKDNNVEVASVLSGVPNYGPTSAYGNVNACGNGPTYGNGPAFGQPGFVPVGPTMRRPVRGVDAQSRREMLIFLIHVNILVFVLFLGGMAGYISYLYNVVG